MSRLREESGAILVYVVLLLPVIIGVGALAVDAGALYQEHRELQNGADAAALALAQSCAEGNTIAACNGGQADPDVHAEYYADLNAVDGMTEATVDLSQWGDNRVIVKTTTVQSGQDPGKLELSLARILGIETGTVSAEARAKWGSPKLGSIGTLPLVISHCEFLKFGGVGGGAATEPWTEAQNGPLQVLNFHSGNNAADDCAAQAGQDTDGDGRLPGGFGWVDTGGDCSAVISDGGLAPADPGASPDQNSCSPDYVRDNIYQHLFAIPVFTDLNGLSGNNGEYTLTYYAAFYVAAYNFGGQYKQPPSYQCPGGGSVRCIAGWFSAISINGGQVDDSVSDTGVRVWAMD